VDVKCGTSEVDGDNAIKSKRAKITLLGGQIQRNKLIALEKQQRHRHGFKLTAQHFHHHHHHEGVM